MSKKIGPIAQNFIDSAKRRMGPGWDVIGPNFQTAMIAWEAIVAAGTQPSAVKDENPIMKTITDAFYEASWSNQEEHES